MVSSQLKYSSSNCIISPRGVHFKKSLNHWCTTLTQVSKMLQDGQYLALPTVFIIWPASIQHPCMSISPFFLTASSFRIPTAFFKKIKYWLLCGFISANGKVKIFLPNGCTVVPEKWVQFHAAWCMATLPFEGKTCRYLPPSISLLQIFQTKK